MTSRSAIRQFVVVRPERPLEPGEDPLIAAEKLLQELLGPYRVEFTVVAVPSAEWRLYDTKGSPSPETAAPEMVISVTVPGESALVAFREAVAKVNQSVPAGQPEPFVGVGADISAAEAEYFCPVGIDQMLFGDRHAAARLIGSDIGYLGQRRLSGDRINVVVIDQGMDYTQVHNHGPGWSQGTVVPGTTKRGHGLMVVRNICSTAPDAIFWDVPLIPLAIDNVNVFIANAYAALNQVLTDITNFRQNRAWPDPWVLVNAWAIFDRAGEHPLGDYTQNTHPSGHPFNVLIGQAVDQAIDVVFAAGNCGQFCPILRCGRLDRGPGYSIWGANSHPRVLTTGAVRTDARWLGYSSQGPGQPLLSLTKPDLCSPSNFRGDHDAATGNTAEPYVGNTGSPFIANTGTSAACGLAAGVVAALRSWWGPRTVPPDFLIQRLNATARKTEGPAWNERLGNGILDALAAYNNLNSLYSAGPYP